MLDRVVGSFGNAEGESVGVAKAAGVASSRPARGSGLWAALFALFLLGLLVPVLAAAEWTTPIGLSPGGGADPQVAIDADGDAVFAWIAPGERAFGPVEARTRSAAR